MSTQDHTILDEILENNQDYARHFTLSNLPEEASKHAVIVTCMDSRIDPNDFAELNPGEAYIIRNGGGRVTDDVIRSLILTTRLFATDEYYIIHHTDCGLEKISDPQMRELLQENLGPCRLGEECSRDPKNRDTFRQSDSIAFLAFKNLKKSVIDDVYRVRINPLIPKSVRIYGLIYDVHTGKLHRVKTANIIGRPQE